MLPNNLTFLLKNYINIFLYNFYKIQILLFIGMSNYGMSNYGMSNYGMGKGRWLFSITRGSGINTGPFSYIFTESILANSGTKTGAGLTKLVEFTPNKNDSISAALYDNLFQGICPGFNPLPASLVLYAAPYCELGYNVYPLDSWYSFCSKQ